MRLHLSQITKLINFFSVLYFGPYNSFYLTKLKVQNSIRSKNLNTGELINTTTKLYNLNLQGYLKSFFFFKLQFDKFSLLNNAIHSYFIGIHKII